MATLTAPENFNSERERHNREKERQNEKQNLDNHGGSRIVRMC